jgi:hypothetical protein
MTMTMMPRHCARGSARSAAGYLRTRKARALAWTCPFRQERQALPARLVRSMEKQHWCVDRVRGVVVVGGGGGGGGGGGCLHVCVSVCVCVC